MKKLIFLLLLAIGMMSCEKEQFTPAEIDQQEMSPECGSIKIKTQVWLQGAMNASTGYMNDNLRTSGYLPSGAFSSGQTKKKSVVDFITMELYDSQATTLIESKTCVVQRDGWVKPASGSGWPEFNVPDGWYQIAVRHRNHLGVMTIPIYLSGTVNITMSGSSLHGLYQTIPIAGKPCLWGGDANGDQRVIYAGPGSDLVPILTTSGLSGYYPGDVNMSGTVWYSGPGNDPTMIYNNVLHHPSSPGLSNYVITGYLAN